MDENTEQTRRKPGRPKKKRTTGVWDARRICDAAGCNPIEVALFIIKNGYFPVAPGRVRENVTLAQRTRLLEQVIGYVAPKLSSSTVAAAVQVEEKTDHGWLDQIMADPAAAEAAQALSLRMLEVDRQREGRTVETTDWKAIDGPRGPDRNE